MLGSSVTTVQVISVIVGVFLPLLTNIVTKDVGAPRFQAILLALLSGVSGFLSSWLEVGAAWDWQQGLFASIVTFVIAVCAAFGFHIPTGLDGATRKMGVKAKTARNQVER